jgi:sodium-dependent phosphate cotransporter
MDSPQGTVNQPLEILKALLKLLSFFAVLYCFLFAIKLMGGAFKMYGKDFAEMLMQRTSHPVVGMFIGLLATAVVQSSSATTSIIVGMVACGVLSIGNAVPMVMGANIGTTVTNTLISMAHITRGAEFKRAFAAATVHDFFNIIAVIVMLPLEIYTHFLSKSAMWLAEELAGSGGFEFVGPIDILLNPGVKAVEGWLGAYPWLLLVVSFVLIYFALKFMVDIMKSLVMTKIEAYFSSYLFKTAPRAFILGILFTVLVQSSSITTSLAVPLAGAGILTVQQIFPYTLGANIGTTITAILAALITANTAAISVAFAHLLFNVFGTIFILPIRSAPPRLAEGFADIAVRYKALTIAYLAVVFYLLPLLVIIVLG